METLRQSQLFHDVPEQALEALMAHPGVEQRAFAKGEVIYDPQHYNQCMGLVLQGTVEVYSQSKPRQILLNVLQQGQCFGVATMFHDYDYYISHIIAKTRCTILFISQQALRELFTVSVQAVENYICFLSGRIFFLNRKIDGFTQQSAVQRLAMYLADNAQHSGGQMITLLPFGMNKLADLLGIGRASLYRAEQQLTEQGMIERDGRLIKILQFQNLTKW